MLTGQHPDLDPSEFGLGDFAAERLHCPGQQNPHRHVQAVTSVLLPRLVTGVDLLVVQGDTSSALGGALAGFTAAVPVAHVEAGLRTHDPLQPWPEEEYRVAIDDGADLLFAPTERSAANLRAEQVRGEIHVTGNTSIDAVIAAEARLQARTIPAGAKPVILVTCHRRESWAAGLEAIAAALIDLTAEASINFVLHPNPHVCAQMQSLLGGTDGINLVDPCSHHELLQRMCNADLVLSDSGGIQEEAPALGIPLLVLRDKTERPEGVEAGSARLVGTAKEVIVGEVRNLLNDPAELRMMDQRRFPYGDGKAALRIAQITALWLEKKGLLTRQPYRPTRRSRRGW